MTSPYSPAAGWPGPASGTLVTKWPRFSRDTITPSARSTSSPRRTVIAVTPYCLASSRSTGSRPPTGYRPAAIPARRSPAICWYAGTAPSRLIVTDKGYRAWPPGHAAPQSSLLPYSLCYRLLYSRFGTGCPAPTRLPVLAAAASTHLVVAGAAPGQEHWLPADRRTTVIPPRPSTPDHSPATARAGSTPDRSGLWLGTAAAALGVLAAAAATVSFSAQYQMVHAARGLPAVAALEAAIPDAAALIFASLGIALALHGRRAVRTRLLNLASVATSVVMNVFAAAPGWRGLAIWAMPPVAYALASDTLIGVVRATAIARHKNLRTVAGLDEATPLSVLGGLALWLVRLCVAPMSTIRGLRAWVLEECPVAPGRRESRPAPAASARPAEPVKAITPPVHKPGATRSGTKTARFLALVIEEHGPLAGISLPSVSRICTQMAPQVELNTGAARTALRKAVLAAQNGSIR
jgi:hypothetical protein